VLLNRCSLSERSAVTRAIEEEGVAVTFLKISTFLASEMAQRMVRNIDGHTELGSVLAAGRHQVLG
jgi:hypothetical protein